MRPENGRMPRTTDTHDERRTPARGRCYLYVAPCGWEDLCKVGISRDPLDRLQALHPRWFDFFDLAQGQLVELDRVREARAIELSLGRALAAHRAVAPLTVSVEAGGHTEWFRGAAGPLRVALDRLREEGHVLHPLQPWLRAALQARCDRLFAWTQAVLDPDALETGVCETSAQRSVRDALDACTTLDIDVGQRVSEAVLAWYRRLQANGLAARGRDEAVG